MRWFVLCGLMVWLASLSVRGADMPRKLKPVMVLTGTESLQVKQSFARCCSEKDWKTSWQKHRGRDKGKADLALPQVDFDSYMCIVIFHGESHQNEGIRITEVLEEKECVHLRYRPSWYQVGYLPGTSQSETRSHDTKSFAFVVLPRSKKVVVLEEDVQGIIGNPPVWKERARFASIEKK